jgi:hypothetical protein
LLPALSPALGGEKESNCGQSFSTISLKNVIFYRLQTASVSLYLMSIILNLPHDLNSLQL